MQITNWNDLRFLLALYRQGSLTGAATSLGVDQTTVTRRLRALESDSGSELYEKLRGGAVFTALGTEMIGTAERLEAEMLDLEERLDHDRPILQGRVRLTMQSYFAIELMHEIAEFHRRFPGIDLELIASNDIHSIAKREADIALRIAAKVKVSDELVGRRLAVCAVAVYGVPELQDVPWDELPWIGWIDDAARAATVDAHRKRHGDGPIAFKATGGTAYLEAVRIGAGVGLFACGCPRVVKGLVRLTKPEALGHIWMVTHPELRHSPRIRATLDYWYEVLERRSEAFSGNE